MRIKKIVNNNIVIAENIRGHESVLLGKGLGFGVKPGEVIDEDRVMKTYTTKEKGNAEKLSRLLDDIPANYLRICDEIINIARKEFPDTLGESLYLALIDHLSFAIQRQKKGVILTSTLKWEMQQLYPKEYAIGRRALDIIKKRLDIEFPDDEAAYIAFHFVNAGSSGVEVTKNLTFIQEIIGIVKEHFKININKESLEYNRFLNHLKFFSYQVINEKNRGYNETRVYMLNRFQIDLPDETECVENIACFIKEKYKYAVSESERMYLIIHLHSMLAR